MVTLLREGVTFTFNDGDVENIESVISCNPDHEAMPMSPATEALLYDYNGVLKVMNINGRLTDTGENTLDTGSAITIDEQRQWLEKSFSGFQDVTIFTSNYTSTYNGSSFVDSEVLVGVISFSEVSGEPSWLRFRMTLLVGLI